MRRQSPAAARNRQPILDVLSRHLPAEGLVLEVASGSGQHVVHFAEALPHLLFQPSDPDERARASVDDWVDATGLGNVRRALALDATAPTWPIDRADALVCINMIHIAPWRAAVGLAEGAARTLPAGGMFYLYGPFRRHGWSTAPSNEAFDRDLRASNAAWGLRNLDEVAGLAMAQGFAEPEIVEMPANNFSVIFRKR